MPLVKEAVTQMDADVYMVENCGMAGERICRGGDEIPEDMQALFRYIMTGKPMDELTGKLQKAVEAGLRNEKWRSEYMKELLHDDDMREEGRAEGREEGREEERANTEREKARADALEEKVRKLEAIINKMNRVGGSD